MPTMAFLVGREARALADRIKASPSELVRHCVQRIHIGTERMTIAFRLAAIGGSDIDTEDDGDTTMLEVPLDLRRCGMAMRLLVNPSGALAKRKPDPTLLALLAKAGDLTSGRYRGTAAIAKAQAVTSSYATRVVQLAFLAPDLVQRITRGEHPPELNAKRLLRTVPLPLDWAQQRTLLGFEVPT